MAMTVFVTLVIWSCSLETRNLRKNDIERAERASQNVCTFASEKCFTYRPETREKAINDCDLRASHFCVCVSETCDSSQYCVGESHSLSVQCVLMFVTLVIIGVGGGGEGGGAGGHCAPKKILKTKNSGKSSGKFGQKRWDIRAKAMGNSGKK